jgi:hypothetical protein
MLTCSTDGPPTGERGRGPEAVLVTVHGTWAFGAPWAKDGSTMSRAVKDWFSRQGGSATVMPFEWSGRNSIAARRTAGASLVKHLDCIHHEYPEAAIYVIAHSHGGSVFAYSTKLQPEIVDQVDGFIALATPWVGVAPWTYAAALRKRLVQLTLFVAYAASLLALMSLVYWISDQAGVLDQCKPHANLSEEDEQFHGTLELRHSQCGNLGEEFAEVWRSRLERPKLIFHC